MGFDALSPWHLLILAGIFVLLFGAKKLPGAARSVGQSMRIFKAETKGLRSDHHDELTPEMSASAPQQSVPPGYVPQSAPAYTPAAPASAAPQSSMPQGAVYGPAQQAAAPAPVYVPQGEAHGPAVQTVVTDVPRTGQSG